MLMLIFLNLFTSYSNDQDGLKLELNPINPYIENSNVLINVKLKNQNSEPIILPLLFYPKYYIEFVVKDIDGNLLRYIGAKRKMLYTCYDIYRMEPNSYYSQVINLSKYYKFQKGEYSIVAYYIFKDEGKYKDKNLWEGKLVSNKIIIKIE